MSTQATLTKDALVEALIAQVRMRRLQNAAYHRLVQRVLASDQRQRRAQIVSMPIAARAKTAA